MRKIFTAIFFTLFAMSCFSQDTTTLTGTVQDDSTQIWANASWVAKIVIPGGGGTAKFFDGTSVPSSYTGFLDASGSFPATTPVVGNTAQIVPFGVTWQYCFFPVASAPSQCFNQATSGTTFAMGAYASNLIKKPFVQAGVLVYAYNLNEIHDSQNGNGYINSITGLQYFFSAGVYVSVAGGGGGAPTGPAGGALAGTYPSPTLANVGTGQAPEGTIPQMDGGGHLSPCGYGVGCMTVDPTGFIDSLGAGANFVENYAPGVGIFHGISTTNSTCTTTTQVGYGAYTGTATTTDAYAMIRYSPCFNNSGALPYEVPGENSVNTFTSNYGVYRSDSIFGFYDYSTGTRIPDFQIKPGSSSFLYANRLAGLGGSILAYDNSQGEITPIFFSGGLNYTNSTHTLSISSLTFDNIGSGTNLGHGLVCGNGCVISPSGTGFVSANEFIGVPFCTGFTPTNGQFLQYTTGGTPSPCYAAATGSSAGVTSFGPSGSPRTGVVIPASGDYTAAQVTNAASTIAQNTFTQAATGTGQIFTQFTGATTTCANAFFTGSLAGTNQLCIFENTGTSVIHFGKNSSGTFASWAFDQPLTVTGTFNSTLAITSSLGTAAITSATGGTGVTSVTCATAACEVARGSYTVVGGTFVTGNVVVLVWPTTTTAWVCTVIQNGGATSLGLGHPVATATGLTITNAVTVASSTFTLDYQCEP